MLYLASLMLALAVEQSGLHRRVALRALAVCGPQVVLGSFLLYACAALSAASPPHVGFHAPHCLPLHVDLQRRHRCHDGPHPSGRLDRAEAPAPATHHAPPQATKLIP